MKIFIEVPIWLGDAVMATPAIQNLIKAYPNAKITILGSLVSVKIFEGYPNVEKIIINDSKSGGNRYKNLINLAKNAGLFDIALSFRRSFSSKLRCFL